MSKEDYNNSIPFKGNILNNEKDYKDNIFKNNVLDNDYFTTNKENIIADSYDFDIRDIIVRVKEGIYRGLDEYIKKNNLSENDILATCDDDLEIHDPDVIRIISDFIKSHLKLKEEVFATELADVHNVLHSSVKASVLADVGIEKLKQLESGLVSEEDRKIIEAQIMVLFVQVLLLKKERERVRDDEPGDNRKSLDRNVYVYIYGPEFKSDLEPEPEPEYPGRYF